MEVVNSQHYTEITFGPNSFPSATLHTMIKTEVESNFKAMTWHPPSVMIVQWKALPFANGTHSGHDGSKSGMPVRYP